MDEQRLARLLSSNSSLRSFEIKYLQEDIQSHEAAIRKLEDQLLVMKAECQARKALLSPLRRSVLPPEILGEIFCHTLPACPLQDPTEQVVAICMVSRGWREAALATPRLWVPVRVLADVNRGFLNMQRVDAWLLRAGTLPRRLEVYFRRDWLFPHTVCPLSKPNLAKSLVEGPELESLSLSCDSAQCIYDLLTLVTTMETTGPRQWSFLRSLDLDLGRELPNELANFSPLLPQSLTSLSLSLPDFENTSLPDLSHPSVSTLKIISGSWPVAWILRALKAFPELSDVTLDFMGIFMMYDDGPWENGALFTFPKIRILRLLGLFSPQPDNTRLLRSLSTPSLITLNLSFVTGCYDVVDPDLPHIGSDIHTLSLHSNNLPALKVLQLEGLAITARGMNRIFLAVPSITHLRLDGITLCSGQSFLEEGLIPMVQDVELLNFGYDEVTLKSLHGALDVLKTRGPGRLSPTNPANTTTSCVQKISVSVARTQRWFFHPDRWRAEMGREGIECSIVFKDP